MFHIFLDKVVFRKSDVNFFAEFLMSREFQ